MNTLFSKSLETEKAKSSHFDRTRGDKYQIFPTLVLYKSVTAQELFFAVSYSKLALKAHCPNMYVYCA